MVLTAECSTISLDGNFLIALITLDHRKLARVAIMQTEGAMIMILRAYSNNICLPSKVTITRGGEACFEKQIVKPASVMLV